MTKTVRIENADTASYKVRVRVEHLNAEGVWVQAQTHSTAGSKDLIHELPFPTALATEYLTSTRRLVVEEYT